MSRSPTASGRAGRCVLAALLAAASVGWIGEGDTSAAAAAELISVDKGGNPLNSDDAAPSVSADGNTVVFTAFAPLGAEFWYDWVWVRNRIAGTTTAVPTPYPLADAATTGGVLSRDGCHVAYWGYAPAHTELRFFPPIIIRPVAVPAQWDIYTWNVCTPDVAPVDVSAALGLPELTALGDSRGPLAISADGRYVAYIAFTSAAGQRLARIDTSGVISEALLSGGIVNSNSIDISDDGAFIAIGGQRLVGRVTLNDVIGWTPPCTVGLASLTCTTEVLSLDNNGRPLSGTSTNPSLSADGRYVAFSSDSSALVSLPAGVPSMEVYVRDRAAKVTKLVTDTPGTAMDGRLDEPEISPDGTQIALQRRASDGAAAAADIAEVYVARSTSGYFDTAAFDLVSYGVNDAPVSQDSTVPSMSSNGRYVAFASFANNELAGVSTPNGQNVWMRVRPIALDITPTIDFGTVDVGGQSAPANAVITNTSGVAINISAVTPPAAPFSITTNGCGGVLQPGATCAVTMVFRPTAPGSASSSLNVAGDGLSVAASLVGAGRALVVPGSLTIKPASANYGSGPIGTVVAPKKFVVTNPGGTTVPLAGAGLDGAGKDQFQITANGCLNSLAPNASCTVEVGATITREGASSATLAVLGTGGQSAQATLRINGTLQLFTPTLKMNPGVVSPGEVTAAIGTGFPPDIDVQLAFDREAPFATVHTDASGAFRFNYLLLRNGVRIAVRQVLAVDQPQFSGVFAPLLIDLATYRPSGFSSPAISSGVRSLFNRNG